MPKSTGVELTKKKRNKGTELIKWSTGENAAITHSTGTAFEHMAIRQCPLCKGRGYRLGGSQCLDCRGEGIII
ncbi:MAG: hypothetical protein ACE5HY_03160 [Candidatus Hydrothermarchaeales archaeon]